MDLRIIIEPLVQLAHLVRQVVHLESSVWKRLLLDYIIFCVPIEADLRNEFVFYGIRSPRPQLKENDCCTIHAFHS